MLRYRIKKRLVYILTAVVVFASFALEVNKSYAWSTDTYGTSMAGYYLYVRRTTGSTLLGVMHLSRSSIGIFNTFTAEVPFLHQVTAAVMETPSGEKYYGHRNSMIPGSSFTTTHIYTDGHTPVSVYGFMSFVDYE